MDKENKENTRNKYINLDRTLQYENDPKKAAHENNILYSSNRDIIDKENPEPSTVSSTSNPQIGSFRIATTAEAPATFSHVVTSSTVYQEAIPASDTPIQLKKDSKVMSNMRNANKRRKKRKASPAPGITTSHTSLGAVRRGASLAPSIAPIITDDMTLPICSAPSTLRHTPKKKFATLARVSAEAVAIPPPVVAQAVAPSVAAPAAVDASTLAAVVPGPVLSELVKDTDIKDNIRFFVEAPRPAAVDARHKILKSIQDLRKSERQCAYYNRRGKTTAELAERREAHASDNGGLGSTRTNKRNTPRVRSKENHNKGNEKPKKQRIVKVSINFPEVVERTGEVIPGDHGGGLFVSMSDSSSEPGQPAPDPAKFLESSRPGPSINTNAITMPPPTTISTTTKKRAHQSTNTAGNAQAIDMVEGYFTEVRASRKDIKEQPTINPLCIINTEEDTWVLKSAQYEQAFKAQCYLRLAWFTGKIKEDGGADMGGQAVMAARDGEIKVCKETEYEKLTSSQKMTGSTGSSFVLPFDVARFKINGTTDPNGVSTYRIPTKWMIYIWFEPADRFWPPINLHQVDNLSQEGQKLIKHRKATVVKDVKVWARSEYDMDSDARQRWKVFTSVGDQDPKLTEAPTKYELAVHVRWPEWYLPSSESIDSPASTEATAPVPSPVMEPSQSPPQPTQPFYRGGQMEESPAVSPNTSSDSLNRADISTGSRPKPAREIVAAYWGTKPSTKRTSLSQKQIFFNNYTCIICNSACELITDLQAHMAEAHKDLVVHYEKDVTVDNRLARWAIYEMRLTPTKVNKGVGVQVKNKDETVAASDKLLGKDPLKPTEGRAKKDNNAGAGFAGARDVPMARTSDDPFVEGAPVMGAANSQLIRSNNEYVVPPPAPVPVPLVRSHPVAVPTDFKDAVMEDAAVETTIESPAAVLDTAGIEDAVMEDVANVPLTGVQPPVANEVAAVEPNVVKPAQPKCSASAAPPQKPLVVPKTLNGRKRYDHVTHLELIPGEPLSGRLIDTQWQRQKNNYDVHMTKELTEDEMEFTVFWDEFVRADPARGTTSQISFEALRTLVINNWLWLYQRRPRMSQLMRFLWTLSADAKVTNDAVRKVMTLFTPPHVEAEAYKTVERDTAWTAESLEKNAKCRDDLWTLLKWLWERSPNPLEDPAIKDTRAQYINVATPMLHTHDLHTLNKTINLFIEDAVLVPKRRLKDDNSLRTIEASGSDVLPMMHNISLARATGEYRAFHDVFEKLKAKMVDAADIPGQRWKFLLAFRSMHIRELVARWEWRRLFEIECHVTHVSKGLAVEQLLEFLAALRSMGGTTDPKFGPDTHPRQTKLAVSDLQPQELKDAPIYGTRISITRPQQLRTPLECKCGREVMASGGWVKCRNDMWPRAHRWMCAAPYYHQECAAVSKLAESEEWHCDDCMEKRWLPMEIEKKAPAEVNVEKDVVMEDKPEPAPAPIPTTKRKLFSRRGGKQGGPAPKRAKADPVAKLEAEI